MKKILMNSLAEIDKAAKEFLDLAKDYKVFAIYGSMGAGKTTFIKALCRQLNVKDDVTSPTFAIINEYQSLSSDIVYHFDLYRLKNLDEAMALGVEDYLYSGNRCFIEWPELIESLMPDDYVRVDISEIENGVREIVLQ